MSHVSRVARRKPHVPRHVPRVSCGSEAVCTFSNMLNVPQYYLESHFSCCMSQPMGPRSRILRVCCMWLRLCVPEIVFLEVMRLKSASCFQLLQQLLQPVWEELVVRDRLAWAHELGLSCQVSPAFAGSPRDLALVVLRPRPLPEPCRLPALHPDDPACVPCTPPAASPAVDDPAEPHHDDPRADAAVDLPLLAGTVP